MYATRVRIDARMGSRALGGERPGRRLRPARGTSALAQPMRPCPPAACISQLPALPRAAKLAANGSPRSAGVIEPAPECGAPFVPVSPSPDSRLGRPGASPYPQARAVDAMAPGGPMFVGIDVSKDRLDVHVRSSGESFEVARDGQGLGATRRAPRGGWPGAGRARGDRRVRDHRRGGDRGGRPAVGGGQPGPDPRLRPCRRPAGEDRPARRRADRPFRRAGPADAPAGARRAGPGPCRAGRPSPPARRDDRHGEQPPAPGTQRRGPQRHRADTGQHSRPHSPISTGRSTTRSGARRSGGRRRTC